MSTSSSGPTVSVPLEDPAFFAGDPHPAYAELRAAGEFLWHERLGSWILPGYDGAKQALKSLSFTVTEGNDLHPDTHAGEIYVPSVEGGRSITVLDPPEHTELRRRFVKTGILAPRGTSLLEPRIREIVREELLPKIGGGRIDAAEQIAKTVTTRVLASLIGDGEHLVPTLVRWWERRGAYLDGSLSEDPVSREMEETARGLLLDPGKGAHGFDLVTTLRRVAGTGDVNPPDLMQFMADVMIAGWATPAGSLSGALLAFAEHPSQWQALRADPSVLSSAVEEALRWETPFPMAARTAKEPVEIVGHDVDKGERVIVLLGSANRDEAAWEHAGRFEVRRLPKPAYLAFGAGAHGCPGAPLARGILRVFLEEALQHVAEIQLVGEPVRNPSTEEPIIVSLPLSLAA